MSSYTRKQTFFYIVKFMCTVWSIMVVFVELEWWGA